MLIVDEPPSHRITIHPLKKVDDFIIGQIVGENSAYDEVGASFSGPTICDGPSVDF
jgi:hypothetical protein